MALFGHSTLRDAVDLSVIGRQSLGWLTERRTLANHTNSGNYCRQPTAVGMQSTGWANEERGRCFSSPSIFTKPLVIRSSYLSIRRAGAGRSHWAPECVV